MHRFVPFAIVPNLLPFRDWMLGQLIIWKTFDLVHIFYHYSLALFFILLLYYSFVFNGTSECGEPRRKRDREYHVTKVIISEI